MHHAGPDRWQHDHDFLSENQERSERQTWFVIGLTAVMMVAEIAAGSVFNSMALLADGWHMASHASALSITAFAYWFARRHRQNARFSFGTWKVGVLGGFSSAVLLGVIALLVAWESFGRFFEPLPISFDEAIFVASLGLLVNLFSAWLLREGHTHGHGARHAHEHVHDDHPGRDAHPEHHPDHNLRAAYLHVLADALTSMTAIVALIAGKFFGWGWMDPAMGIVGSIVIARWSYGLLHETSSVLLDGDVPAPTRDALREAIEARSDDVVSDLHVWRVGPGRLAAVAAVVSDAPRPPEHYKQLMQHAVAGLAHVTVEVNRCADHDRGSAAA
jgi:cation diffusion facilitator family transporter